MGLITMGDSNGYDVILVYPGAPIKQLAPNLPLSVLPVAGALIERGYHVKILDMRVEELDSLHLENVICVGVSAYVSSVTKYALEAAKYIRHSNPDIPLVWGGVHPTNDPDQALQNKFVDIIVRREGEHTLTELVDVIKQNESIHDVLGISYKNDKGETKHNPDRPFLNMDKLPSLPYHLLKQKKYWLKSIGYQSSRGCAHRCAFCYNHFYNKFEYRSASPEKVLDDIETIISEFHPEGISFIDDNFFQDKNRVEEICKGFVDRDIDIYWDAMCRLDYFSKYDIPFLELVKKSGCDALEFGGESGSQKILNIVQKDITPEETIEAVNKCKLVDIQPIITYMTNLPTETKEDVFETLSLIDELTEINDKTLINGISMYTPYPGAILYDRAVESGIKVPEKLEEWSNYTHGREIIDLPWTSKPHKKLIKSIAMLSAITQCNFGYVKSAINEKKNNKPVDRNRLLWSAYWNWMLFIVKISQWRWRNRFFHFPIDLKLATEINMYVKGHPRAL